MVGDLGDEAATEEAIPIPNVSPFGSSLGYIKIKSIQVNEAVLKKVIEWCQHHKSDPVTVNDDDGDSRKKTTDIEEWDQKFMQVDQEMLFEIILVSHHPTHSSSSASPFLSLTWLRFFLGRQLSRHQSSPRCRLQDSRKHDQGQVSRRDSKTFNIQNDFTPEEEDQIRRENEWAEE